MNLNTLAIVVSIAAGLFGFLRALDALQSLLGPLAPALGILAIALTPIVAVQLAAAAAKRRT